MTEQDADLLGLIERGDTAGLEAALKAGADARQRDRWGAPALARAAARGDLDAVRLLLDHGAEVDQLSDAGNSPLMAAAAHGNLEVIETLLAAGADPESKNKWGLGAADWAQWPADSTEVLALLRSRGG
jgi:ankyrin repeat protein